MTRSLAAEYGPKVRVNTLSPGPFLTDIAKAWDAGERDDGRQRARPARAAGGDRHRRPVPGQPGVELHDRRHRPRRRRPADRAVAPGWEAAHAVP